MNPSILAFLGPIGGPELIFLTVVVLPLALIIPALISCLKANFQDPTNKIVWVLVILLAPIIGPILYFCISPNQRRIG